uniref:Uncharacterized protein n=1 Tax=Zea mays TaxID=4577 RepID=A0A804QGV0_MAIZE
MIAPPVPPQHSSALLHAVAMDGGSTWTESLYSLHGCCPETLGSGRKLDSRQAGRPAGRSAMCTAAGTRQTLRSACVLRLHCTALHPGPYVPASS